MNGKALKLAKPEYPLGAKTVGAHGIVSIEVLIDEQGNVIEAKAIHGNPLLIANSIKAAKSSKFEPIVLKSGEVIKVSGVIIYNYLYNRLNWLEIGYCFEVPSYIYSNKLENYLLTGFDEEKQMLAQLESIPVNERKEILQNVSTSIEGKLSSKNKNLWLFSLGKELGKLSNRYLNDEDQPLNNIQNLLYTVPENVSPILTKSLKKLILTSRKNPDEFYDSLTNLVERFYGVGN